MVSSAAKNRLRRIADMVWTGKLKLQRVVMVVTSAIFTLLVFYQVIVRYVFSASVFGIEEIATYAAVWLYFIGGAHAAHERGHISASLLDVLLPSGRAHEVIRVLTSALTVVLSAWMTWWSLALLNWTLTRGTTSLELGVNLAWVHTAMPVGLALMTLYFFVELLDHIRAAREAWR